MTGNPHQKKRNDEMELKSLQKDDHTTFGVEYNALYDDLIQQYHSIMASQALFLLSRYTCHGILVLAYHLMKYEWIKYTNTEEFI